MRKECIGNIYYSGFQPVRDSFCPYLPTFAHGHTLITFLMDTGGTAYEGMESSLERDQVRKSMLQYVPDQVQSRNAEQIRIYADQDTTCKSPQTIDAP
ncbi:hypothetical protein D3C71_1834670 [compost metagenome]